MAHLRFAKLSSFYLEKDKNEHSKYTKLMLAKSRKINAILYSFRCDWEEPLSGLLSFKILVATSGISNRSVDLSLIFAVM
jgi:hypothetical protein